MNKIKVFVSSTFVDLQDERRSVENALHRMQTTDYEGMEYFGSRPETPKSVCLSEVDSSQIYLGIFGFRYGSLDAETQLSMTELEYLQAQRNGFPCLIYLKSDEALTLVRFVDREPNQVEKLENLKKRLKTNHSISYFTGPDELATKVVVDLHNLILKEFLLAPMKRAETLIESHAYSQAVGLLSDLVKNFPADSRARLLFALALLGGRNPDLLSTKIIKSIESNLAVAQSNAETRFVALVALAVVKYDSYIANGMNEGNPRLDEILRDLKILSPTPTDLRLLGHIKANRGIKALLGFDW